MSSSSDDPSSSDSSSDEDYEPVKKRTKLVTDSSSNTDAIPGFQNLPGSIKAVVRVQKDHLICPVCQDFPRMEVYQCSNGHIICHGCIAELTRCPLCRIIYPDQKIRNRVAETELDDMTYNCSYKNRGCLKTNIPRNRRNPHEIQCRQNPSPTGVKFCKLFNAPGDCQFRICPKAIMEDPEHAKDVIQHLKTYRLGSPSTSDQHLSHEKILIWTNNLVKFRLPILPNQPNFQPVKLFEVYTNSSLSSNKPFGYFVLVQRASQPGRQNLSWAVVALNSPPANLNGGGNPQRRGKITVNFVIKANASPEGMAKDGDGCVSDLSWTVMSTYLDEWKEFMMIPNERRPPDTFSIPENFLTDYYKNPGPEHSCEMVVKFGPVHI